MENHEGGAQDADDEDEKGADKSIENVKAPQPTQKERDDAKPDAKGEEDAYARDAKFSDEQMTSIERGHALELRKKYAEKGYSFVKMSVILLFVLLGVELGFRIGFHWWGLSSGAWPIGPAPFAGFDKEIWLTLIGAVTVNILGVFLFVIKNLFPPKNGT